MPSNKRLNAAWKRMSKRPSEPSKPQSRFTRLVANVQWTIKEIRVYSRTILTALTVWAIDALVDPTWWVIPVWIVVLWLTCSSCATIRPGITLPCPTNPEMQPVHVINGTISGQDLTNSIDNHDALWAQIHRIRALGCRDKQ